MTPKEKAKSIIVKFNNKFDKDNKVWIIYQDTEESKRCALICVDEMLDIRNGLYVNEGSLVQEYLLEVKKEIQLL